MSNLKINIRFMYWHLQVTWSWKPSVSYNKAHKGRLLENGFFKIYQFDLFAGGD